MIAEEAVCSGIIVIQIEVEEFVSLSVSFLEEKAFGLQHGLNSWLCHSIQGIARVGEDHVYCAAHIK